MALRLFELEICGVREQLYLSVSEAAVYKNCLCAVLWCVYSCGVCNEVYKWERKVLMRLNEMLCVSSGSCSDYQGQKRKGKGRGQLLEHSGDPYSNRLLCW